MGQETICKARFGDHISEGKALLETDYLLFRSNVRVKIPFSAMTSVQAKETWLEIESSEGSIALQLGAGAEKWAHKILHPPSRLDKLGVKNGMLVSVSGVKDNAFVDQLTKRGAEVRSRVAADSNLIFLGAEKKASLVRLAPLSKSIKQDGAIWVIYPKGVKQITEADVFGAMHAAGLVDTKVASFSSTHTALKAVIPLHKRA